MKKFSEPVAEDEMTDEEMNQFFHLDPPFTASSQPCNPTPLEANLQIPRYLSSIHEPEFAKMIDEHAPSLDRPVNKEAVRHAAVLTHHLTILTLEQSLWTCYLKCGTGTLTSSITDRIFWPASVVAERTSDHDCLEFVQRRLRDLENEERTLHEQWSQKITQIDDYEGIWARPIQAFVVEQTESSRQNIHHQIEMVEFDYQAYRLEGDFLKESPSKAQVQSLFSPLSR